MLGGDLLLICGGDFFEVELFLCGQCRFAVVGMAFKRLSLKFPMLCCDLYKEIKTAAFVCVCGCLHTHTHTHIYIYI